MDRAKQIAILLSDYQNLIFTLCYRMTQNYFEAEDLAQETFVAAYEHLDHFDGQHEKAWLCRIAMNKCLDFLKKDRRRAIPQEEDAFLYLADQETIETHVLAQEVQSELKHACESLPPPYRAVALAHFYEEKDAAEIAREQNKNVKTVQTQIYRARARLQKIYGKEQMPWDGT
ncbi:MAG TPA: RNA polymerase sigma factor [Candidatus Anaerotignum merdipullorum]|nr:RNA polymerase sigma factor [Candidatus Anaerotignum merdipullorum]